MLEKKPYFNHLLTLRYIIGLVLFFAVIAILAITLWHRIGYINTVFGGTVGCNNCFVKNVLIFDGPFLGVLVFFYLISMTTNRWWLYLPIRLIVLIGTIAYIADYILAQNLYTRLTITDIQTYGTQASVVWDHILTTGILEKHSKWIIGITGLLIVVALGWPSIPLKKTFFVLALPLLLLITVCLFASPTTYVHNWAMYNIVSVNFSPGESIDYSDTYRQTILKTTPKPQLCATEEPVIPGDIVVLILESWSPYQSQLWGGEYNWTPKIDAIAKENIWLSNFYAGGFVTNEGLASILTGNEFYSPVVKFFNATPFEGLWNLDNTLPKALNRAGYSTTFLTTGNLKFSDKGDWLSNIGFNYIEGHDSPVYTDLPRLHFGSAADEHLYARALAFLDEKQNENSSTPTFLTIENVSTHQPFIHPHTREANKEAVFRYMDDTVADFYDGLLKRDFFNRGGLLLVVSDHRSMTPISKAENDSLGSLAASKIPFFIVSNNTSSRNVDTIHHQSDFLPTMQKYAFPSCDLPLSQNFLAFSQANNRCVLHARGDKRDYIDIICSEGKGRVELGGDATRFIESENINLHRQEELIKRINTVRLQLQENHRKYQELKKNK